MARLGLLTLTREGEAARDPRNINRCAPAMAWETRVRRFPGGGVGGQKRAAWLGQWLHATA